MSHYYGHWILVFVLLWSCLPFSWPPCTATVPVSQHYPGQYFQLLLSLYSSHALHLAESQYLGRIPPCHHIDILTHRSFMSKKSVQALHPWIQIRTSYMRSFTPFSDRNVTLVSSPKNDQPGTPASLQAGYSCGMGPGVGHRLKRWQHLFSCHFDLCVLQIMWFNTERKVLHEHAEIWCALIFIALLYCHWDPSMDGQWGCGYTWDSNLKGLDLISSFEMGPN